MRIPFPERISLLHVFFFAALLSTAQVLEGTLVLFSLYSFLFIIVAAFTFNLAGGLSRPSGVYVFFFTVLSVIVGLTWKAIVGEPAQSNLAAPLLTMEVYLGTICAMLLAVYISRKVTLKQPLLGGLLVDAKVQSATIGCMITGLLLAVLLSVLPHENGSVISALAQLDRFLPVAILIGVTHQIRKSGGTSSITMPVLVAFVSSFIAGVLGFSKEGMLTPFFCWIVAASSMRYKLSIGQIIGGIITAVFIFQFLVPYAQYGRVYKGTTVSENISSSISLLSNLEYVREQYATEEDSSDNNPLTFYDTPQGFFDRLQMIGPDDALINVTEQDHPFGLSPLVGAIENMVPHVFWPNKPDTHYATMFAQEIGGILPEDDTTTGISFSPAGEAFHMARWAGILIIAPIVWVMLFTVFDSLCGDVRKSPWGLLVIPLFAHAAPEGGLGGVFYLVSYGLTAIVFAAFATSYLMPILGSLVSGPGKTMLRRTTGPRIAIPSRTRTQPLPPG